MEEGPNVLFAEDDGMEMGAEEDPEDEEVEPFEDAMVMVCPTSIATTPRSSLAVVVAS